MELLEHPHLGLEDPPTLLSGDITVMFDQGEVSGKATGHKRCGKFIRDMGILDFEITVTVRRCSKLDPS